MTEDPIQAEQIKKVKQSRFYGHFAYLGLGVCLAVIGLFLYWAVYPYDVLKIYNNPVPVEPRQVRASQLILLKPDFCKMSNVKGTVIMYLVLETKEVVLPSFTDSSEARCEVTGLPVLVPKDLEKGRAHIRFVIRYHVNPIRVETEVFASQDFEIIP